MEKDLTHFLEMRELENINSRLYDSYTYNLLNNLTLSIFNTAEKKDIISGLASIKYIIEILKYCSLGISDAKKELTEEIRNTEYYKECTDRYNYYISSLANLIGYTNLKTPLEYSYLYITLLYKGYFSINGKFEYKKEKFDSFPILELTGARILEGNVLCRHSSMFLGDLLTKLDVKNYQQFCRTTPSSSFTFKDILLRNNQSHLITTILENDEKFSVDALNYYNPIICENQKANPFTLKDLIYSYKTQAASYKFIDEYELLNSCLKKIFLDNVPDKKIEYQKLRDAELKAKDCFIMYRELFKDLKEKQIENMKRIVELEHLLIPHGDVKPKTWVLK